VGTDTLPELLEFRAAYGRMCTLAAVALKLERVPHDDVREALHGNPQPTTRALSLQRIHVSETAKAFYYAAGKRGVTKSDATKQLISRAREVRDAVESEWGTGQYKWTRLTLPLGPNP